MKFHLVYKTSTTPFFPICLVGRCFSGRFKEISNRPLINKDLVVLIKDNMVSWFFDKSLSNSARKIFNNIYSVNLIDKIKKKELELSKKILDEIKTPIVELFSDGLLNQNGENKLRCLFNLYTRYANIIDAPGFLFQLYLTEEFRRDILTVMGSELDYNFLISSYKKTNYEKFLFSIKKVIEHKISVKEIVNKFYWLIHDYLGEIIDSSYVKGRISEFRKSPKELNSYLQASEARIKKIKAIKKKLKPAILKKVQLIQEVLYLYNERKKEVLNQSNIYIRKIIECKFPDFSISELGKFCQLSPEEIIMSLKGVEIDYRKRSMKCAYLIRKGKIRLASQKYFSLVSTEVRNLKGIAASPGKIKGRINIILNISHLYKFQAGDILVAPFTSVNYLPIMGRAKAILTETGGSTSHAATVSREFGIPCIVGIENLLLSLTDGELVEVDADKGIVRKLN